MEWSRTGILCLFALLTCQVAVGEESASVLVQQLGHPSFQVRVAAEQELLTRGMDGLRAAGLGAKSNDPEIRRRSQRLVSVLQKLAFIEQQERVRNDPWMAGEELAPAWEFYQSIASDSPAARNLYVKMIEQESELMTSVVLRPKEWTLDFERRCADLRTFVDRRISRDLNTASIMTLLFLALHPDNRMSPLSSGTVGSLISDTEFYSTVMRAPVDEREVYVAFLSQWVESSGHSSPASRLQLASKFQLKAGVAPALEILSNYKSVGLSRTQLQNAIGFLAVYGSIDVVPELEKLLDPERYQTPTLESDGSFSIPEPRPESLRSKSEQTAEAQQTLLVNDTALLAILRITKQDPSKYGFANMRIDNQQRAPIVNASFATDGARRLALSQWLAWRIEHARQLLPPPSDASEGIET